MHILVDAPNLAFRTYFAPPLHGLRGVEPSEDSFLGSIGFFAYSFCRQLGNLVNYSLQQQPTFSKLILVWDGAESLALRKQIWPEYKSNRFPSKEEAPAQDPIAPRRYLHTIRKDLEKVNPRFCVRYPQAEADDLLAVMASRLAPDPVLIVTRDADMYQLIDDRVKVYDLHAKLLIDEQQIMEWYGFTPKRIIEYKALAGDTSDNYPGLKNIGHKKAIRKIVSGENVDMDDANLKVYRKLATLPYPDLPQVDVNAYLDSVDFQAPCDWKLLVEKYAFGPQVTDQLKGVF